MNDDVLSVEMPEVISMNSYSLNEEWTLCIHTDEEIFSKLDTEWTKLAQSSNQMICMSPGWATSWWKHFGRHKDRSLFLVTVYDHHKLIAIFPFYKGITKFGSLTVQKRLQLIGSGGSPNEQLGFSDDYGISDFLDVIVDPYYKISIADIFVKLLLSRELSNYKITFHQVRDDSFIMETLYPLLLNTKCDVRKSQTDVSYYIEINRKKNFQDFILESKPNARRRFRQTLRARGVGNEYIIEEPTGLADVERMVEKLIQLHQDRWNKIGYPGVFQDERFREFLKEISIATYKENRLWLKQAVDESGVCAVRLLLMYNRRFYDYMSGYDDESPSAKHRPGIGLLLDLIENSFQLPIDRIELLRGDEGYKHDFNHITLHTHKITIPETKNWKSGWGLLSALIQFCSIIHKYFTREKILMKVQFRKVGFLNMFQEYFKFRMATVLHKIKQKKE